MFKNFDNFSQRCCLIDGSGQSWSYYEVSRKAQIATDHLAGFKKLVFLMGGNTVGLISAYIGAMRGSHTVHFLDPSKPADNDQLIKLYAPNALIYATDYDYTIASHNPDQIVLHPDLSVLLSTSGSTGSSKFVKLSHGNVASNTASIVAYLDLDPEDRAITTLKPFYSYGFSVINTHLNIGASLLLSEYSVQDPEFWQAVKRHQASNLPGVPHTFQTIYAQKTQLSDYTSLRFMTQAGGKLGADLVTHFAREGETHGFDFFVMYGQTEAAPRISYLPPELALQNPASIGKAVPGGKLWLIDPQGRKVSKTGVEGELVYSGPNVMIGYASESQDLANYEHHDMLFTGDLAIQKNSGLFEITGRSSRIVKPFGLRISLDEIESIASDLFGPAVAVSHGDEIRLFFENRANTVEVQKALAGRTGLPALTFMITSDATIPRLSSGKPDYRSLQGVPNYDVPQTRGLVGFTQDVVHEFWAILTGRHLRPASVLDAFEKVFVMRQLTADKSFRNLGGDSLMMLQLHLLLEEYFDEVPENWQNISIVDLEKSAASVGF